MPDNAADGSSDRSDLAALIARIMPRLMELETPILEAAGISMWEYAIMTVLAEGDAMSQIELSKRSRRDPTRLGRHLDDLSSRGLVVRGPATDQRRLSVRLTDEGRAVHGGVKRTVAEAEDALLATEFSTADVGQVRNLLERLASACDR